MKIRLALIAGLALSLIGPGTAQAANTWTVNAALANDANCNPFGGRMCKTIGVAVLGSAGGDTINVVAGTYPITTAVQIPSIKPGLKLLGPNWNISPNDAGTPTSPNAARVPEANIVAPGTNTQAIRVGAANVTIAGFQFTDPATAGLSQATIIGAGGFFGGLVPSGLASGVSITNNRFSGITRVGVFFNGNAAMNGGTVDDNRVEYPTRATGCGPAGTLALNGPLPGTPLCGHQVFNLWMTDHLSFQRNVILANPNNLDRIRVLTASFENGPSLQSDSPNTNITIAHNTVRYSCVFTCFTLAAPAVTALGKNSNVVVEDNDVHIDVGNIFQLHSSWKTGTVNVRKNIFTDDADYAVAVEAATANLTDVHVTRNSLTGGGFRNQSSQSIDGTCNWWGSASGPAGLQNFGPVTYSPWLITSTLTGSCSPVATGTQPADDSGLEGDTLTASGSFTGTSVSVTRSPPLGTLTDNGDGTWSWSYLTTDNFPATTITVTGTDAYGGTATETFDISAANVAPTATFNAPASVPEGSTYTISLTGPFDPSSADTSNGFTYAFDCGAGFGAFGPSSSAMCTAPLAGTQNVQGKIRDKDSGTTPYSATVTVMGTYQVKQQVRDEISAAVVGASKHDADRLEDAAKKLTDSLELSLWDGVSRLQAKHGEKVFQKEKEAVQKLLEILNDKKSTFDEPTLEGWVDALVAADRTLALTAIADATGTPGYDAKKVAEANKEMDKAADELAKGKDAEAIEHYKNAWKKAQEAVKKL